MPVLEHVIFLILVGFAIGLWRELSRRRKATAQQDAHALAEPQDVHDAPAPDPSAQGTLTARLYQLENSFAPFTASSAHPRELLEHPEFKQAADLLADPAVPLDIVMQYAHGRELDAGLRRLRGAQAPSRPQRR